MTDLSQIWKVGVGKDSQAAPRFVEFSCATVTNTFWRLWMTPTWVQPTIATRCGMLFLMLCKKRRKTLLLRMYKSGVLNFGIDIAELRHRH